MKKFLVNVGITLLLLVAVAILVGAYITGGNWFCDVVRFPDAEARFEPLGQFCMVNTDEGWIPEDRYRVVL